MPAWNKDEDDDRREFLKTCGRFVAVTPPAMTLLLSTSLTSRAIARSGGRDGRGNDDNRGRSFFDNDPPAAGASGTSGSSSLQGDGASQSRRGAASGDGGAFGGGAAHRGAASSTNSPGNRSTSGASGCADDGDEKRRRKLDCDPPELNASNLDRSERIGMRQYPGGH